MVKTAEKYIQYIYIVKEMVFCMAKIKNDPIYFDIFFVVIAGLISCLTNNLY